MRPFSAETPTEKLVGELLPSETVMVVACPGAMVAGLNVAVTPVAVVAMCGVKATLAELLLLGLPSEMLSAVEAPAAARTDWPGPYNLKASAALPRQAEYWFDQSRCTVYTPPSLALKSSSVICAPVASSSPSHMSATSPCGLITSPLFKSYQPVGGEQAKLLESPISGSVMVSKVSCETEPP